MQSKPIKQGNEMYGNLEIESVSILGNFTDSKFHYVILTVCYTKYRALQGNVLSMSNTCTIEKCLWYC